jgi:hypothetical protein
MKEKILRLKGEGKPNKEIVQILGCSKATVSYHCSEKVKQSYRDYRNKNRKKTIKDLKVESGGKCFICEYDRCFTSLHFHHKIPSEKIGGVSEMVYTHGKYASIKEAKKCVLVCANCHGEIEEGIIKL